MNSILVVDDSHTIRQLVQLCLEGTNFKVEEAEDGVEALALAKENCYGLVITDIYMPNMSGTELIKALRLLDAYQATPIYILTTDSDPNIKALSKEVGASGWILKPINIARLTEIIHEVFDEDPNP